jgi:hypothetical protein
VQKSPRHTRFRRLAQTIHCRVPGAFPGLTGLLLVGSVWRQLCRRCPVLPHFQHVGLEPATAGNGFIVCISFASSREAPVWCAGAEDSFALLFYRDSFRYHRSQGRQLLNRLRLARKQQMRPSMGMHVLHHYMNQLGLRTRKSQYICRRHRHDIYIFKSSDEDWKRS